MSISDVTSAPTRLLGRNLASLDRVLERMATGRRLNRGADGPAALITAEGLRATLASIDAETRSMERARSVATVADDALASVGGMLADAQALVVASANEAGLSPEERAANQAELDALLAAVDDVAGDASFGGVSLLDGSLTIAATGEALSLDRVSTADLGAVEIDGDTFTLADLRSGGALELGAGNAESMQTVLQRAIDEVATTRGRIGSFQTHTLDAALDERRVAMQSMTASLSAVADGDLASDMVELRVGQLAVKASIVAIDVSLKTRSSLLDLLA